MISKGRVKFALALLVATLALSACDVGNKEYELTDYIGKSVKNFERRTKADLQEQSNEVYGVENTLQVIALDGEVTAVTLLENAANYAVYGVKVGMEQAKAEELLTETFGQEISKNINASEDTVTYTYTNEKEEIYVTYGVDTNIVAQVAYYQMGKVTEEEEVISNVNQGELMAMIGDHRIYYNEAMVYLKSVQEKYEEDYGNGIWAVSIEDGKTFGDMIKDEVMKQITELKIISDIAKKKGISLEEDELAEAKVYAKDHYGRLTQDDIQRYSITLELLEMVYQDNILASKVFEIETLNVDNVVSDEEAKQVTVQHILIYSTEVDSQGNRVDLLPQDKETKLAKVQELLTKAKETEDFLALAEANSDVSEHEFTFGRGQAPEAYSDVFEQTAFLLKTGEVSDIITTNYGWHIIYSVSDYNLDATTEVKESIIDERRTKMFAELYTGWTSDYDIILNSEAWKAIAFQ